MPSLFLVAFVLVPSPSSRASSPFASIGRQAARARAERRANLAALVTTSPATYHEPAHRGHRWASRAP